MTLLVVAGIVAVAAVVGLVHVERAGGGVVRGLAPGFAITSAMSRLAVWKSTLHTRPRTRCWPWFVRGRGTPACELGIDLGSTTWWAALKRRVFASFEAVVLVFGPPGTGKSGAIARYVRDAPGPGVVSSTAVDLWKNTVEHRQQVGPVFVFNPEGNGDVESTMCWPIVPGCEDPQEAILRAGALVAGVSTENLKDADYWKGHAHRALYCQLMAAALDEADMAAVEGWATDLADKRPASILRAHKSQVPAGWADSLEWLQNPKSEKLPEGIVSVLKQVVEFMSVPSLAAAVLPQPGRPVFDAETMIRNNGTLYIVARHRERNPLGPLSTALTTYVHETATRLGEVARLDPPLGEFDDEATFTARTPLPEWTSTSRKYGIYKVIGVQNMSQLEEVWETEGRRTIWNNATIKLGFGSITDEDTLEALSELCGTRVHRINGRLERVPVMRPDAIKNLPDGQAVAVYRNQRAVLLTPEPVWARPRKARPPQPKPATATFDPDVADLSNARARREHREAS